MKTKAVLALADGTVFWGRALGFEGETLGEVVFNTAMTGYQEVLSDPSYRGQIVTMTCPHIGNYGTNDQDQESGRIWAEGFIIRESSQRPSNWRAQSSLHDYLTHAKIVGIEGVDTRALTRHIREHGSQQAMISHTNLNSERAVELAQAAPSIKGRDLVAHVTCGTAYTWKEDSGLWRPPVESEGQSHERGVPKAGHLAGRADTPQKRMQVVVYDFGVKQNILRRLVDVGCAVTVVPASTPAEEVMAMKPDGILLSNGPGDPEGVPYAVKAVQQLIGVHPLFGICLGHQILGLALGLETFKLKFGHHGANHPVMDLRTKKVEITSQNHNFAVKSSKDFDENGPEPPVEETEYGPVSFTHMSLNDRSIEGMVCLEHPVFSVQYHPEASPGPHDSAYLFDQFVHLIRHGHV